MHKKFIVIFSLFLFHYVEQFAMFRHVVTALQKNSLFEVNSAFTNEFLRLSSRRNPAIFQVRLLSQVPIDKDLENRLFKLAAEEEVEIRMLVNKKVAEKQKDILEEMENESIEIEILQERYSFINWQKLYAKNHALMGFKITNNENIPSAMTAALISYHSGQNIALLGKPREAFSIYNDEHYRSWEKKFDAVFFDL